MPPTPFRAAFDPGSGVLSLGGDIDDDALLELHRVLENATDEGRRSVLVDLAMVTYLPSTAVGMLVLAIRRGRRFGHAVELQVPGDGFAASALRVVGLEFRPV